MGEAAGNVTEATRQYLSNIPWREIVGMRNRLVHVYFDINIDILWTTVKTDLPVLISLLEPNIPLEPGQSAELN
ncbi:MAG: DUF86 domain-containing protein [Gammaproteobacteria bacterium]|nr:DUF86 domain-containing protein [Gammaproteobacteria bacterium]